MRVVLVCLVIALTCSCRQVTDGPGTENSGATITTREEVLRIMRDDYLSRMIDADWLPSAQRAALRRIKNDYHAKVPRRHSWPDLIVPELTWDVRGPLMMSDATREFIEDTALSLKTPAEREELRRNFEETGAGRYWARFADKHEHGDEVYYYSSDKRNWDKGRGTCGYVLIRGQLVVGRYALWRP